MATNTTVNLTPEQQRALASFNSYLQTRTGATLTIPQQTAPKQVTDAEITEYLKAVTQSPSSSGKDITANILKDWGQGNRYTAERILADAYTHNVGDERLAGILGVTPEAISSTKNKIVNYRKLANTLTPSVGEYLDPLTGKDYSSQMGLLLAAKLDDLGLNEFGQIEKRIIKGDPEKTDLGSTEYLFEMPTGEWETSLARSGPDGWEYVNLNDYEIGQRQAGDGGYTTVAARRKNIIPATPDVTKYYDKNTGQEITNRVLLDDKAGTKYVLTEQGIQKQFDPTTRLAVQLRSYVDPSSTGGAWGTKGGKKSPPGFGPEGMMRQIAQRVQNATGVSDINDLELKTVTKPRGVTVSADNSGKFYVNTDGESRYLTDEEAKTIRSEDYVYGDGMSGTNFYAEVTLPTKGIYNKKTGQKILDGSYIDLGGWGEGPGITYASMTFDANGKPKISTYGEDTNTLSQFQPIMTLASIIPSPIQPFAVAANAANAAYNYGNWAPAIMAAAGASGILDSIAGSAGASNSGIAGLAQDLGASANLANSIGRVGAQSLLGGTLSAAQGKGFLPGAKSGLVSSVIGEGVNALGEITGLDKGLGSLAAPARSLVSSALTSTALGTPFKFSEAAKNAAIKFGLNTFTDKANLTPQQGTALNSLLEYLGKKA